MTPSALGLDAARLLSLVALATVAAVAVRRRGEPSGRPFAATTLLLLVWTAASVLPELPVLSGVEGSGILGIVAAGGALGAVTAWLLYVLAYTGRGERLSRRRRTLLAAPAPVIVVVLVAATGLADVAPAAAEAVAGVSLLLGTLYGLGAYLIGVYLLSGLATNYGRVPLGGALTLAVGIALPYLGAFASTLSRPTGAGQTTDYLPVDVVFVGTLGSALLLGVAIRRYPVFSVFPGAGYVARDEVVETLREAIVVLDRDDRVLDLNDAAARLCEGSAADALGEPIDAVIDASPPLPTAGARAVEVRTPDGRREFEVSASPIGDRAGRTLVLRDVTERNVREQRLDVFERVLRHNLRNDLDAILAYAGEIDDPAIRSPIRDRARHLADVGEKARDAERLLAADGPPEPVDVAALVRSVAETVRARSETAGGTDADDRITVEAPAGATVRTRRRPLERSLTELVENAVEHGGDAPRVELTVRPDDDWIEIAVADDGPGIPPGELDALRSGTESQLEHGSGVGLWLVSWAVDRLGGELSFADGDPGTVVTVRLRRDPPAPETESAPASEPDTRADPEPDAGTDRPGSPSGTD